jgi:hypothetical protein
MSNYNPLDLPWGYLQDVSYVISWIFWGNIQEFYDWATTYPHELYPLYQ